MRKCSGLKISIFSLVILLFASSSLCAEEIFPHRSKYSDVKIFELEALGRVYDDVVIIDVRSEIEYDVVHVKGAVSIPLAHYGFEDRVKTVRKESPWKKIVFYCNGNSCQKSYKAARKAKQANIENIYAFDAGVFSWVTRFPERSSLLGQSPARLDRVIDNARFRAKMLSEEEVAKMATDPKAFIIDVREPIQQEHVAGFPNVRFIQMSDLIKRLESEDFRSRFAKRDVVYIDAVGKQVRWLQYYLERYGQERYYFLKGGVNGLKSKQPL